MPKQSYHLSSNSSPHRNFLLQNDGEITVFAAEKYFSMNLDNLQHQLSEMAPPETTKITTSASSEATTTSQDPLVPLPTSQTPNPKKPSFWRTRVLAGFGCRRGGFCFNNKHGRLASETLQNQEIFPFHRNTYEEILQQPRRSLEVFGSKRGVVVEKQQTETKLCMLTWDAIVPNNGYDEITSAGSSGLFENIIGSLQPSSSELDSDTTLFAATSPRTSTTNYAPSEASIQWSVVTASAADFAEYNEENISASVAGDISVRRNADRRKQGQKSRASGLLGCRSHKSVQVSEACAKNLTTWDPINQ